ncbi:hypothetical protein AAVH_22243 [Aphelenchoides avenae]|nr:hypothetical protein AAVH_22243 [Aphelenchus avenae]
MHPLHPPQPFFFQPPSLVPGPQPQALGHPQEATRALQLPDVEACLQRLAVLQEKERLFNDCNAELEELKRKHVTGVKDHLDAQLALKTEVQRLTADNEKLRTQKHAIEQLRDRLRRELHDAKKETTAVDDERQIDRTKLQAAESLIAELRAQLAAEKSKNVAMEVEAGIREEEALELRMKLRQALKANTLQQEMSVSSTSLQKTTELDADEKETLQEDDFAVVIHSSPASPDPSGTDADREVLPESSVPTNYRKGEVVAASTADRKGAKKIRAYFRALKDHGLPVEAILERLRSKHANATSAADGIPAVPKARSANKKT